jgi:hypothetical protein
MALCSCVVLAVVRLAGTPLSLTTDFRSPIVSDEQEWQKDVDRMLTEFLACQEPIDDISPCNRFLARALKRVYGITDFDKPNGQFMTANEIAAFVKLNTDKWTDLGSATTQTALTEAAGQANVKKAIIAVLSGEPNGHVALVLPGQLTASGQWKLNVPNSASFFLKNPQKSYIGKGLSFAFAKPDGVRLFGRNF